MENNRISHSPEYISFRSSVTLKKVVVDDDTDKIWAYYDSGPRDIRSPIIFMPPASGTGDVFFRQILALTAAGYRVLSVEFPVYWSLREWLSGFRKFLDFMHFDKVHLFGASLGGYFAQKFSEYTYRSPRIHSLILCNAFSDTTIFKQSSSAPFYWMMPSLLLKKMVMGHFTKRMVDIEVANSIDFMVDKLDSLSQPQLASRLTLNCMDSYVEPHKLRDIPITLIDVFDECALSQRVREEMYKCYPSARRAHLKSGGNFPYLSRAQEVNIMIQVHLAQFENTRYSAREPRPDLIYVNPSTTNDISTDPNLSSTSSASEMPSGEHAPSRSALMEPCIGTSIVRQPAAAQV